MAKICFGIRACRNGPLRVILLLLAASAAVPAKAADLTGMSLESL
jgi:hypothetical protein